MVRLRQNSNQCIFTEVEWKQLVKKANIFRETIQNSACK